MGLFERLGKWIDKGIEKLIGKSAPAPLIKKLIPKRAPISVAYKEMKEEAMTLWREERIPVWKRKMMLAIDKGREEYGWTEEEIMEKYGEDM